MLGVGVQILDDVKNLTTGVPGKRRGDDVVEGKKSLPVLLFMNKYKEKQELVFYCFHAAKKDGIKVPEVEEFIEMLTSAGVISEAEEIGQSLLKQAGDIFGSSKFADCTVNKKGQALLEGLIKSIS